MLNKKLFTAAVTTALMAGFGSTQVLAADDFAISGNIALTSDYRFRGISQTDEDPAVQGGFDVSFEPGFYLGTWASTVDFDANDEANTTGSYGNLEVDYYGGWKGPIGDSDFGVDVGYAYYQYPSDTVDPVGDYQEFYVKGSWTTLVLGVFYSDDNYAKTGESYYLSGDYSYGLIDSLTLGLHAGYSSFDEAGVFLSNDKDDYTDYSVSLTYNWASVDFSVAYVGTDLDEEDYFDTELAEPVAVFTIKKAM
jgi:uncharacterized protein (TIGR02001 family)